MDSVILAMLLFASSPLYLFFSSNGAVAAATALEELPRLSFEEGYTQLFGDSNLVVIPDGKKVHIALDERTGAGFASQDLYLHGFYSASIKLPANYAAGVVVTFYMSNGDMFEKNHDELDFEFLGNIRGREWRVQTNIYGNGSTHFGREERYNLWFDPTEDFHQYSILWRQKRIIFYIDNIPIREIQRTEAMDFFPSKPMTLYSTIWDGSSWATSGGRYKVNYKYAPYVAEFKDLVLHGCVVNPMDHSSACERPEDAFYDHITISAKQRVEMERFRRKHVTYSYCYDRERYPTPPLECSIGRTELRRAYGSDGIRNRDRGHRHKRSHDIGSTAVLKVDASL